MKNKDNNLKNNNYFIDLRFLLIKINDLTKVIFTFLTNVFFKTFNYVISPYTNNSKIIFKITIVNFIIIFLFFMEMELFEEHSFLVKYISNNVNQIFWLYLGIGIAYPVLFYKTNIRNYLLLFGIISNISWFLNVMSFCITRNVSNSIYYNLHSSKEFFELRTSEGYTLIYLKNSYPFELSFYIGDHFNYLCIIISYVIMFFIIKKFFISSLEGMRSLLIFGTTTILLGFYNPLNKTGFLYDPSNNMIYKMLGCFIILNIFYQFCVGFFSKDIEKNGDKRSAPPRIPPTPEYVNTTTKFKTFLSSYKLTPKTQLYLQRQLIIGTGIAIRATPLALILGVGTIMGSIIHPSSTLFGLEVLDICETINDSPIVIQKKTAIIADAVSVIQKIPDKIISNLFCPPETGEDFAKSLADLAPPIPTPGVEITSDIIVKK